MCGILLCMSKDENAAKQVIKTLTETISNRGPDSYHRIDITEQLSTKNDREPSSKIHITFVGCVLWLRGQCPQSQPLINQQNGDLFLWNGDVFEGVDMDAKQCDTSVLGELLSDPNLNIPQFMSNIRGPFAFIYYQRNFKRLWFGRDFFGRHSLLIHKSKDYLILSSATGNDLCSKLDFIEVPAAGIYQTDLDFFENQVISLSPYLRENSANSKEPIGNKIHTNSFSNIGNPLNCKVLNSVIHSDILQAVKTQETNHENVLRELLLNDNFSKYAKTFENILLDSVRRRVVNQPGLCKDCVKQRLQETKHIHSELQHTCKHPKIGVLFSGGLDSAVLAALAHLCLPACEEIDLINVAFEQQFQKDKSTSNKVDYSFNVPDRQTGLIALEELRKAYPERNFNFVMVNVEKSELIQKRKDHIKHLLFPLDTVLDDSIGCAIWFAARGIGILLESNADNADICSTYQSPCRVILLGMGADEQLGGYSRHRERFRKDGFEGLINEIRLGNKLMNIYCRSKVLIFILGTSY